jgi:tape measure domain-containing protein
VADRNLTIIISAKDMATKALKSVEGGLDGAKSASTKLAMALGIGAGGLGASLGILGKQMFESAGNFEQSKIAFTTMLGSAEKADKLLKEMTDFAKKTPFELRGLEDQTKKLLAYGFEADNVLTATKMLGDISAGVGMDKLPQLTLAFGQVKAATRLTGAELRQFSEAGVPLLENLAKQSGKTAGEMLKMISKGEVSFEQVQSALSSLTEEGGKFYNMMEKQSGSLNGMISNLRDAWDLFLRNEGAKLLDWGKQFVQWAIYLVQVVFPQVINAISATVAWFDRHRVVLAMIAGALVGALIPALIALATTLITVTIPAFVAGAIALAPFMLTGAVIAGIVLGAYELIKHWSSVKGVFVSAWEAIKGAFNAGYTAIKSKVDGMIEFFKKLMDSVNEVLNSLNKFSLSNITQAYKNLPANLGFGGARASGGPVSSGSAYLVGERGPELFVPSSSGRIVPNGGGGVTINITGNTLLDNRAAERIGDLIIGRLGLNAKL